MLNILCKYVLGFIDRYQLFDQNDSLIISCSGGMDSQLLVKVIESLYLGGHILKKPRVLYIDHQTRSKKEHAKDVAQVKRNTGLEVIIRKVKKELARNDEDSLRALRYEVYKEFNQAIILQAHHIDDSFEWYLMHQFKSSKPVIGIPVKNKNIRRPFMCLSRQHVELFVKKLGLAYHADKTNEDENYERNFVRHRIVANIKEQYPHYLKSYISQMNQVLSQKEKKIENKKYHLFFVEDGFPYEGILNSIKFFSNKKRGSIRAQLEKLKKAVENKKTGPLLFSGNVKAYIFPSFIMISPVELAKVKVEIKRSHPFSFEKLNFLLENKTLEQFLIYSNTQIKLPGAVAHFKIGSGQVYDLFRIYLAIGQNKRLLDKTVSFYRVKLNFSGLNIV